MFKISLVALILMVTALTKTASIQLDPDSHSEMYKILLEKLKRPEAVKGAPLMWHTVEVVSSYLSSLKSPKVEAIKTYLAEKDLEEENLADQETKDAMINEADKTMELTHEDYHILDGIRNVMVDLICDNEKNHICSFWRFATIRYNSLFFC